MGAQLRSISVFLFLLIIIGFAAGEEIAGDRRGKPASASVVEKKKVKAWWPWSTCSYTVQIKTSCYSPLYTRDIISIAFGDAYGNQVYASRLDDPASGAFSQCSTDTYGISGPCGYGICYVYLRREGYDGWTPSWVQIYDPYYYTYVTFYYGTPLPNAVWYGYDDCYYYLAGKRRRPAAVKARPAAVKALPVAATDGGGSAQA